MGDKSKKCDWIQKGPSFHQTRGSHCGVEETGHLRCNPCWPIILTGILKDSSASIFRVKQCKMSRVLTPKDASTTILPNTCTYWPVNMASSTFLFLSVPATYALETVESCESYFLNKWCSTNTYLLLLISFPVSLQNCIRVQDFKMLVHWPT
jgi:hypothetical protein